MFRPNLQNEEHRRAWEILQTVPEGQKNAFLVQVILENAQREELETILRRVLREELKAVPSQPIPQQEEAIPKEMMGFLGSLLREEYMKQHRSREPPLAPCIFFRRYAIERN